MFKVRSTLIGKMGVLYTVKGVLLFAKNYYFRRT